MPIPTLIPSPIPATTTTAVSPPLPGASQYSLYDVAIGGLPFVYANTTDNPSVRSTAPFEKTRIDQASTPGEQTLTGWWIKSQDSFHGGAGQLQLEPAVPTPVSHVRFEVCKNVDVFTPGMVSRLPDTVKVHTNTTAKMMPALDSGGNDAVAYINSGNAYLLTALDGTPVRSQFSHTSVSSVTSIATDGRFVYAATNTQVWQLDPTNVSAGTSIATYPATATNAVLGWQKDRLMLGVAGSVWALDVSQAGVTLVAAGTDPYYLYTHPTAGFTWRCFAESPTAILGAGDAGGFSVIQQFDTQDVSGTPTLQADGVVWSGPSGEIIHSLRNSEGTFLGIGTSRGHRVGEFDSYFGRLTAGPLQLLPTDPVIPTSEMLARGGYLYAVGADYDESGIIAIDLGTKTDSAGRFAWAPHLITDTADVGGLATAGCVLVNSQRIAFATSAGIFLEGVDAGTGRESSITTSRIRYDTTEPKLFKLGRVRGDLTTGEIIVSGITADGTTPLGTFGFVTIDPDEFKLPAGGYEWMQLQLKLSGATTILTSYGVKALPGTRRQRHIQPVLSVMDEESSRNGLQLPHQRGSARARLEALEQLDAAGDEVLYQEYTPSGVVSTVVVIEQLKFTQIGRPTGTSDVGGQIAVLMRTVEG